MATVLLYKTECSQAADESLLGTGFSLLPWEDGPSRQGEDDGGRDYVIPKGYTIEHRDGVPGFYDEKGTQCPLQNYNGFPVLVDGKKRRAILIERDKKILRMREEEGLTREELAAAFPIKQSVLYLWENCEQEPTMAQYRRLAELLHCEVVDLI